MVLYEQLEQVVVANSILRYRAQLSQLEKDLNGIREASTLLCEESSILNTQINNLKTQFSKLKEESDLLNIKVQSIMDRVAQLEMEKSKSVALTQAVELADLFLYYTLPNAWQSCKDEFLDIQADLDDRIIDLSIYDSIIL